MKVARAVVVLTHEMNDKLFGGANSVGKTVRLDNEPYTVTGVLDEWRPLPRFYDLAIQPFGDGDAIFMPFTRAIDKHMAISGSTQCNGDVDAGLGGAVAIRLHLAAILGGIAHAVGRARSYRAFLNNYAAEQQRLGRFHWPPHTQLRDVKQWLRYRHVVPSEVRILILVSFGFLAGVPDERDGPDAGENHGTRGRYRRAPRPRRQPRRDIRAVPDRDRRGGTGRRNIGSALTALGLWAARSLA